jgi:predicted ester cyclase
MALSPEAVVRAWFDGLWNKGDETTIDRLLHPDGLIRGLPTPDDQPLRGPVAFKPFYRAFRAAFPDISIELAHVVVNGDLGVAHCYVTGTHRGDFGDVAPTHRAIEVEGFAMARVVDGKVAESWNCFDFLALYRQLGVDLDLRARSRGAGA